MNVGEEGGGVRREGGEGVHGRQCECCTYAPTTNASGFVCCLCLGKARVAQGPRAVCADAATCPFLALHFGHPLS
jgi:hypothetical protein